MECNNVTPQFIQSACNHVWETYPRHNAPKQPHLLCCVQSARPSRDPVQALHQLPGDCNPSTKPIHNPTAPPKMPWISLHDAACTSATLRIGNKSHSATKHGSISVPSSSKKHTSNTPHQERSLQCKVDTPRVTAFRPSNKQGF